MGTAIVVTYDLHILHIWSVSGNKNFGNILFILQHFQRIEHAVFG